MYHVINTHINQILKQIPAGHVSEYDYLHIHLNDLDEKDYQRRFKVFWRLNTARLCDSFCDHYFKTLKLALTKKCDIKEIVKTLHGVETHRDRNSLQFSFASKLLHMIDDHAPIYDSMVADFFFYNELGREKPVDIRIQDLAEFYNFLSAEYRRIIDNKLLADSIKMFRNQLRPRSFTDEKVIDSLIWAFVALQKKGGAAKKQIIYC